MKTDMTPKLHDDALYLGDNGICLCGKHSGMTARYTGHDISGQRVVRVTTKVAKAEGLDLSLFKCETCGIGVR